MAVSATSIWTTLNTSVTWDGARALAKSWGGDLTSNLNFDHTGGRTHHFHGAAWVGVSKVGSEFFFLDGSKVRDKYPADVSFDGFYLSIGDAVAEWPAPHPLLVENYFEEDETGRANQLVWDVSGSSIKGTIYNDAIVPADISGKTIDLGAGNDEIFIQTGVTAPAYIKMGAGDDVFSAFQGGYYEVRDGDGADTIDAYSAKIIAALDGDNDTYYADKLVYDGAKAGITVVGELISSSEIGNDRAEVYSELTLGSGNDVVNFTFANKIYTKGGDDVINIFGGSEQSRLVDAGDGNDMLSAGNGGAKLIGGNGDDKLSLYEWDGIGKVEMTGGSGSDRFEFATVENASSLRPIINDFAAKGAIQDTLDLTAFDLSATSVADAFGKGLLSMTSSKGYSYIAVDGGDTSADLTVMLKGTFASEIYDNIWI